MFGEYVLIQKLLASVLVGYLLGSIPLAHTAARLNGMDIFSTGSRRAGTANVYWNVSRRVALVVFGGDVAKGALAVTIAGLLGIHGPLLLLAGGAAVLGHWNSIFTGFRGGDGMATLLGIALTLVPVLALLGIAAGFAVVLIRWRSPYRTIWGIASCYILVLVLSLHYDINRSVAAGLGVLAALVLGHSILTRRRLSMPEHETLDLNEHAAEGTSGADLGPAASDLPPVVPQ